jgi:hypothetical protein
MHSRRVNLKLLFDFGLVILIWMTQLIVYPSFSEYSESALLSWHPAYTIRITIIVVPLMFGQLGMHILDLIRDQNKWKILAFILIILAWANTFFFAVPLHNQIAAGVNVTEAAADLVTVNAYRTFFWTAVFGIDLYLAFRK